MDNSKTLKREKALKKAIELLESAKEGWPVFDTEDYYRALELGLEALKLIRELRLYHNVLSDYSLPGED